MHARVATFEGGDPERVRELAQRIEEDIADGPPPDLPAIGVLMLHRPADGRVVTITLFENEDDMLRGDATLNAMSPRTPSGVVPRTSVELFEVAVKIDL
jgi:hypothetical protein